MANPKGRNVSSSAGRGLLRFATFGGMVVAAVLVLPEPAEAHNACCVQCVNPHGQTIPPAGSAVACDVGTMPSDNAFNAGFNPDGFFQVGTNDGMGGACVTSGSADVELFNCTDVFFDAGTGQFECTNAGIDGQFCIPGDPTCTFANGTLIKYTEANGAKSPSVNPMAGNNSSSGNPNGGSAVMWELKASGDLLVCPSPLSEGTCALCLVPPPPK
jgi:hypothetical protein